MVRSRSLAMVGMMLVGVLGLGACATAPEDKAPDPDTLVRSVTDFHQHLRWRRYTEASAYLREADQGRFLGQVEEDDENFRVVEYEIRSLKLGKDGKSATSKVEIQWLREPDMTVRKDKVEEQWEALDGRWVLVEREVKHVK